MDVEYLAWKAYRAIIETQFNTTQRQPRCEDTVQKKQEIHVAQNRRNSPS